MPKKNMTSAATSRCSIWGSAPSHRPKSSLVRRSGNFDERMTKSDTSIYQAHDVKTALLTGDRNVVCKTEAEFKANKLNRSEQCRLEHFKGLIKKETVIRQRQYEQSERLMLVKSAQLKNRINQLKTAYEHGVRTSNARPGSTQSLTMLNRPKSSSAKASRTQNTGIQPCTVCTQIQKIIHMYEQEKYSSGDFHVAEHSTCLFSDNQVRTFLQLLEAKHFQEIPNLTTKLRDLDRSLTSLSGNGRASKLSRREIELSFETKSVENRIKDFCADLDKFNKDNNCIPDSVKESLEKTRHENAVLFKPSPFRKLSIREEAEIVLNVKSVW